MASVSHHIKNCKFTVCTPATVFLFTSCPSAFFFPTSVLICISLAIYSGCACAADPWWLSRKLEEMIKLTNKVCYLKLFELKNLNIQSVTWCFSLNLPLSNTITFYFNRLSFSKTCSKCPLELLLLLCFLYLEHLTKHVYLCAYVIVMVCLVSHFSGSSTRSWHNLAVVSFGSKNGHHVPPAVCCVN